jgi:16S rRNA (adenine1518-N6/adenine1519-N6)-dimethyltransferase
MVLIVQKEVAQRICAKAPDMNLLAVSVQFYARPKIISYISKKSFWPQPKVDSAIIKITTDDKQSAIDGDLFFKIVKAGFSQPRKQLINNLSKKLKIDKMKIGAWLWRNNIQPNQRAETLSVKDWLKLTKAYEP